MKISNAVLPPASDEQSDTSLLSWFVRAAMFTFLVTTAVCVVFVMELWSADYLPYAAGAFVLFVLASRLHGKLQARNSTSLPDAQIIQFPTK